MDAKQAESEVNKRWSWAMEQVRAHPKTAVAMTFAFGLLVGLYFG